MKPAALACIVLSAAPHAFGALAPPSTAASSALPATLPVRRDADAPGEARNWAPSLALAIAAGVGGAWAWRRRSGGARSGSGRAEPLVRVANLALTPQASVHAVQWRGEEWLLACTPQQVTLLSRRAIAAEDAK